MFTISPLRESLAVRECVDEAREEAWVEAREESSRKHLLLFWESRVGAPVDWVRHRVESCKDVAVLDGLMQEQAQARRVSQVEARVKATSGMGYRGDAEHLSLNQRFAYKNEGETCP